MEHIEIYELFYDKFAIHEEKGNEQLIITVYPKNRDGSVNLDVGIKLKNSNKSQLWTLFEVQRDQEYELGQFNEEEIGLLALFVSIKGRFEKITINESVKEELRGIEKDLKSGQTILQNNLNNNCYSLNKEKKGAINLFEENHKYNICYLTLQGDKILISKGRPMSSALVVTYNYGRMLEEFDCLIKPWKNKLLISLSDEENLKRIYIGK